MKIFKKFADSAKELGKVQCLAVCSMMLALRIVFGIVGNVSLGFLPEPVVKVVALIFIPVAVTGYLYGPICAALVAGLGDIFSYLLQPTAFGFNPGITACYVIEGLIYGICLYHTEMKFKDLILTKALSLGLCTLPLQSYILYVLFSASIPYHMILFLRAAVLIPFAVIEIFVLRMMHPLLERVKKLGKH